MGDCEFCHLEKDCHYPFKPTECVMQRKFWSVEKRAQYDKQQAQEANESNGEQ